MVIVDNDPRLLAMKLSLIVGATTLADVKSWADQRIEWEDIPSEPLIDLSLARDVPLAISQLSILAANSDREKGLRIHFQHLLRALDEGLLDSHDVARWLYTLALEGWTQKEDSLFPMYYLDDYYDHPGLGDTVTEEQANRHVREFLEEQAHGIEHPLLPRA